MSRFVLDASLAAAWLFEDEQTAATEAALDLLTTHEAVVPPLWEYEIANVIVGAQRRGRMSAARAIRASETLVRLPIRVAHAEFVQPVISSLVGLAWHRGLTAHDAAYLWLAERTGLALGTCDRALADAARASGVPLLVDQLQA